MLSPWLFGSLRRVRRTAGRRSAAKRQAAHRARFRPRVELLETRFAPALLVGPNVNISRFTNNQDEATIAMDPTNPSRLFESSNDTSLASTTGGLLAAFSVDGGIHWTRELLGTLPSQFGTGTEACCDSQAVFDDQGNLFVSYLNFAGNADILLLSQDGGQTFRLLNAFAAADQPKVAVGAGSVWVAYLDTTGGVSVSGAHVTGLGAVGAFTVPVELSGSIGANFGEMAIGPTGQVMVVYPMDLGLSTNPDNSGPAELLEWENDSGVGGTFSGARFIGTTNVGQVDPQIGAAGNFMTPVPSNAAFGSDSEPKLAWDRSSGPHGNGSASSPFGRVYLVYTDSPSNTSIFTNIMERFSDDQGLTWSDPIKINDNTVPDEVFYPSIAIDQTIGTLAIQFYDTRSDQGQGGANDPSGAPFDDAQLWGSASFDGGVTWDRNVQISAGTSSATFANPGTPITLRALGYGDYEKSTAFVGGVWYPVWADNSNSTGDNPDGALRTLDIYTAKVTIVPGLGVTGIPIIPSPGSTGTTGGLIGMVPSPPPVVDPAGSGTRTANGANAFTTNNWGAFPAGGNWTVVKGDFNGDGSTDIAGFNPQTGQWWVGLSNGNSFTTSVWANWYSGVHWTNIKAGDFTGDGKTDIIGYENGAWWVGTSTGSSFTTTLWGVWSPAVNWTDVQVADFTGTGKADITGRDPASGAWWTGVSTGSSFTTNLWAVWSPLVTWVDVNVGDFTGSGRAGITGRVLQSGQWWTGVSTGAGFATSLWATWYPGVTWVDVNVGDFNGDGKTDIVGRVLQSGQWWVGQSTGSGFAATLWATWSPFVNWVNVQVGDFNGDGMADITGMIQGAGQWWTGVSTGSTFSTSLWASWSPGVNWTDVQVGNFNGEGITAMAGASGQWWTALPVISSGPTSSSSTTIPSAPVVPPPPGTTPPVIPPPPSTTPPGPIGSVPHP